jgi:hypothetical protein
MPSPTSCGLDKMPIALRNEKSSFLKKSDHFSRLCSHERSDGIIKDGKKGDTS